MTIRVTRRPEVIPADRRDADQAEIVRAARQRRFAEEADPLRWELWETAKVVKRRGKDGLIYLAVDPAKYEAWKAKKEEIRKGLPKP